MIVVRAAVAAGSIIGVFIVLSSVLRTVVLPRAVPARLARIAFLSVRWSLTQRLRIGRTNDYLARDRLFALQAPLGLFAQLALWGLLLLLLFSAIFWSFAGAPLQWSALRDGLELAGSSMLTLGFDAPHGLLLQLTAFAAAAVGLAVLALVITYLPSVYGAFARREALITKLVVRTGRTPSGPTLLRSSWDIGRFEHLEEVWNTWEDWFIDVGESHTTFPQLSFFRSPHPYNHWVLAAEAVLDGAGLFLAICADGPRARAQLLLEAGVNGLVGIADFLGISHEPPGDEARIGLSRARFNEAVGDLVDRGVTMRDDRDAAWEAFVRTRARYEPLLSVLGRMTDAPRSEWSSWSEDTPRHSPPLIRLHRPVR